MDPVHETITLGDGYETHTRWWRPARPVGAVLYLHGIESHGGWFEASGAALARAGFTVLMPDRRGSGANTVKRGHARSARQLLADVTRLADLLRREAGTDHIHIAGVSWGGKLAAAALATRPELYTSLTLVSPGLVPKIDLPTSRKLLVALAAMGLPTTRFTIPLADPGLFTENPERQGFIRNDPLRLHSATARFLAASKRLDFIARRLARRIATHPIGLFLAGQDRIIDNTATRKFVARAARASHVIEYVHASHTLEFESDNSQFLTDLTDWLGQFHRPEGVDQGR